MVIKALLALAFVLIGLAVVLVGFLIMFPTQLSQMGFYAGTGSGDPVGVIFLLFGAGCIRLAIYLWRDR